MTSSNGHHGYDEDLLASAPAPTKGMVQSGYATDLLVENNPKPSRRGDIEAGRHRSHSSKHASVPNGAKATDAKGASTTSIPSKVPSKIPFYRTKRGFIILVIVALVLLAAIIGGAVGGTLANKDKQIPVVQDAHSASSDSNSASGPTGDVGRIPDPGPSSSTALSGAATSVIRITTTINPVAATSPSLSSTSNILGGFSFS